MSHHRHRWSVHYVADHHQIVVTGKRQREVTTDESFAQVRGQTGWRFIGKPDVVVQQQGAVVSITTCRCNCTRFVLSTSTHEDDPR